uniref:OCIA domain-containing protein 2 isoform X2 n=1 Tax=Panthera onca TaxID=9690 RepID=UPI002953FC56|nr:OCIA domain-containing protein 2 isoform X2 [Panthera onca]
MASVSTHGNQDKGPHLPPPSKQEATGSQGHQAGKGSEEHCRQDEPHGRKLGSLLFCPKSKLHIHRGEISKIIRECQEESFWKRALPFSLVSMLATQGLVHHGYLASNPRFGSLPKVALAGILGFALGKASYIRVCQSKFHSVEDQLRGAGFGPGHNRVAFKHWNTCSSQFLQPLEWVSSPVTSWSWDTFGTCCPFLHQDPRHGLTGSEKTAIMEFSFQARARTRVTLPCMTLRAHIQAPPLTESALCLHFSSVKWKHFRLS